MPTYSWTQADKDGLQSAYNTGGGAAAYTYTNNLMNQARANGYEVNGGAQSWVQSAININQDSGWLAAYTRTNLALGIVLGGQILTGGQVQAASNTIAQNYVQQTIQKGTFLTTEETVNNDIKIVTHSLGLTPDNWPGVLAPDGLYDYDFDKLMSAPKDYAMALMKAAVAAIAATGDPLVGVAADLAVWVQDALQKIVDDYIDPPAGQDPIFPDVPLIPMFPADSPVPHVIQDPDSCPVPLDMLQAYFVIDSMNHATWTPLVIDLDNDGIELTNLATDAVYWDIDSDGFKEAAAWVKADDALLVRDWNNNGTIDNHGELFGTQTVDGFTKLTELDSNGDNIINSTDTDFANLQIWQDLNQDGISQANELKTLTVAGISSISLNDATLTGVQVEGNDVTHISTVTMADSSTRNIYDAWFKYDTQNTQYSNDFDLDIRTLYVPTLRGYGDLKDLYIQMSLDEGLLNNVTTLSNMTLAQVLDPNQGFAEKFKDMLFDWSGQPVSHLRDLTSESYDSRRVGFVEDLSGIPKIGVGAGLGGIGIGGAALAYWQTQGIWQKVLTHYTTGFLVQTVFKDLFTGDMVYNAATGVTSGATGLSSTNLAAIEILINSTAQPEYGWMLVVRAIDHVLGVDNLSGGDLALLDTAIDNSASTYDLDQLQNIVSGAAVDAISINGVAASQTINGTFLDDAITDYNDYNSHSTLNGGLGDDRLFGGYGNDTYRGGEGDDYLKDTDGSDIYIYESGDDFLYDSGGGTDKVVLSAGITLSDISLDRTNSAGLSQLIINVSGQGSITLGTQYNSNGLVGYGSIETLEFASGSTLNLITLDNPQNGTGGNDTITGVDRAYYLRDHLFGDAGNDTLNGGLGNDVLEGGYGDDTYIYTSGVDTIIEVDGSLDKIVFANTYSQSLFTAGFNPLQNFYDATTQYINIYYDGQLVVIIKGGIATSNPGTFVEKIEITGVTTFDIASLDFTHHGTDASETLYGIDALALENNIIHGHGANDFITGREGNDTLYGDDGDDTLEGNNGVDTLYGGAGNDTLTGGAGNDTMAGGKGDDIYVLDTLSDVVTENANEGVDTVQIALTYTLGANVENLTLGGSTNINGTGNALNNILMGNQWNNILTGGDGNDTLNGNIGDDTLVGGIGDDIYVVDSLGDVVTESSGQGTDTVQTDITYTLGSNVENLTLTWSSAINGTGNSLNNIIIGNANNNTLTGGGGNDTLISGNGLDTVIGGMGDDIYIINDLEDILTESASEGIDTVQVSVTYTLAANFENLTLTGIYSINGTGNASNNILVGNSNINILTGGLGNDTYVIDSASDSVVESASEGTDTVQSSVTYTLLTNFENLTLIGADHINGTGNAVNNIIIGNIGNNTLDGGTGSDTLSGGAGNDLYIIDSGDTVSELASEGIDTVQLAFTGYTLGANVENLTLTGSSAISGTGNSLNNTLIGNSGVNTLTASGGNDTLDGGLGNDTLVGGQGDDIYYIDTASDVVTENASEGTDTVNSAATYTLSTNLENLALTGTAAINGTGNASDNILIGNSGVNTLTGANGHDTLDGGAGNDTMVGGAGNDIYYVDGADVVTEAASSGTDLVRSTAAAYTLASNVENLTLIGTGNINGTGNTLVNILTGNAGNNTLSGGTGADTMIGGLGNDIYVVDNASDVVTENANEGIDTVQTTLAHTLVANVENLTLTSTGSVAGTGNALNNVLTGNSGANTLTGGDGNDTLDGGTGNDTMIGGIGDDIFVMNVATDVVTEAANEGTDTVRAAFTYTLLANFENLTLTGTSAINAIGNAVDNILIGNSGINTLNGGTGNDTMSGGAGNDIYVVDSTFDVVSENLSEGTDLVQSSVTYILSDNVENLTLTGIAAINGIGNDLVNTITGNTGNNILNGGLGNDTMIGGTGNDIYYVDGSLDVVTEAVSAGTDVVYSYASTYTLATNVENLTLMGLGNIAGTGNTANNILTGNTGNNILNGGTGVDTLIGGLGDDTYVIDTLTDTLTENTNEGIDTVQSTVTYTLLSNFENLTLTSTGTVNATGNTLDNILIGNTANNTLTGGGGNDTLDGGTGNDTMIGGTGNDIYFINIATDVVTENASEGTDTVNSGITYTLLTNFENLTLTGASAINGTGNSVDNIIKGNSAINTLTGNDGNDTLYGYDGNDILSGGNNNDTLYGGAGLDAMTGGAGADTFVFEAASAFSNIDTISDFTKAQADKLNIHDLLVGYTSGVSNIDDFVTVTTVGSNTSFLVDRDGAGTTYSDQAIVTLNNITGLTVSDLFTNGHLIV